PSPRGQTLASDPEVGVMIVDQRQTSSQTGKPVSDPARCRTWWGWASPPTLAADTAAKRAADRVLPRGGAASAFFVAIFVLVGLAARLPVRADLTVAGLAAGAAGAWCSVNFWRCRHAHCVVTGAGWLVLAGIDVVGAVLGYSLLGGFGGVAFLAVLATGVLFELGWSLRTGTHAIARRSARPPVGASAARRE
ncbi:MAG: hypothetical protein ACRDQ1_13175, partial [Sciscionella sp.]